MSYLETNYAPARTHRERKEHYIKALEDEVLRLKEIFSNVSQDKDKLAEENKQLKSALVSNGIAMPGPDDPINNPSVSGFPSSVSGNSYAPGSHGAFTPPHTSQSTAPSVPPSTQAPFQSNHGMSGQQQFGNVGSQQARVNKNLASEQAGIDFVLTYDNPSKAYMSPPPQ